MNTPVLIEHQDDVCTLTLNRPKQGNALTQEMMRMLTQALTSLPPNTRLVKLMAKGKHFCAGADLHWMQSSTNLSEKENIDSAKHLYDMYLSFFQCPVPIIARVHQAVMGGALGLVACCDIVLAEQSSFFSLSEARLGLVPATISPFVIAKIGYSHFNALSLQAHRFSAEQALAFGLVHQVCSKENLNDFFENTCSATLKNAPKALNKIKKLSRSFIGFDMGKLKNPMAELIAQTRVSEEGQEGVQAFFEKRSASWVKENK